MDVPVEDPAAGEVVVHPHDRDGETTAHDLDRIPGVSLRVFEGIYRAVPGSDPVRGEREAMASRSVVRVDG